MANESRPRQKTLTNSRLNSESTASGFPPPATISQNSIPAIFFEAAEDFSKDAIAKFREPAESAGGNVWDETDWIIKSWDDARKMISATAAFLKFELGVKKGERVCLLSNTRYEWFVCDLAILSLGAVSTPIYQTSSASESAFVIFDSEATIVFAENEEQLIKLRTICTTPPELPETESTPAGKQPIKLSVVICFTKVELSASEQAALPFKLIYLQDLLRAAESLDEKELAARNREVELAVKNIQRSDLASIVYTSGTTGAQKGVIQTHQNHIAMLDGVLASGLLASGKNLFLFLPLAHSFARLIGYAIIPIGGSIIYPTITDRRRSIFEAKQILKDIKESHPAVLPTVPRILEKIMDGLTNPNDMSPRGKFVRYTISNYQRLYTQRQSNKSGLFDFVKRPVIGLMMRKIREAIFGKSLLYAVSGGAPLPVDVNRFFTSIGCGICEGYGLTETTPAISANTPQFNKIGTVGRVFDGVEVRIEGDGEISARGGNIAAGYWKRPAATKESWTADGWFHTGDIGEIDSEGFLKITDRKKELIVNAGGKKIAPAMVEGKLRGSPYISQVLVFGDRKPYLVALVTIDRAALSAWAEQHDASALKLTDNPKIKELLAGEIHRLSEDLAGYEKVKQFVVLTDDFTVENGLLTPTLKLKRKLIIERYRAQIDALYA